MKISDTIYFDHQATTPVDERVLREMEPFWRTRFGNPHSSDHALGWEAAGSVEQASASMASFIGADPDEIVFTSGATESNNLALLGAALGSGGGARRRILVGATEHKCVLMSAQTATRHGFEIETIPVDAEGVIAPQVLEDMLDEDVLLVSVMWVNNEIGTVQDITTLAAAAARYDALFHCDAVQAPLGMGGLANIAEDVDFLSLSGHKMYGPKGIGALYASRELHPRLEPLIHGGEQQAGLRAGTMPTPLCVGMGVAAELFMDDEISERCERLAALRNQFVQRLQEGNPERRIRLNGPPLETGVRHAGNANLSFDGVEASALLGALQPRLAASTGSACGSGIPEPSHVLRAIGLDREAARSAVRFSLGLDTTEEDVEQAVELVHQVLAEWPT